VHYYIRRVPRIIRLLIDSLLRMYTRSVLAYFITAANGVVLGTVGPVCVCVCRRDPRGEKYGRKSERLLYNNVVLQGGSLNKYLGSIRSAGATLIDDRLDSKVALGVVGEAHRLAATPRFQVLIGRMKHLIPLRPSHLTGELLLLLSLLSRGSR
jgi:hypothetical protein